MEIAVGADHYGLPLKQALPDYQRGLHHDVVDFGCHSADPLDHPDVAIEVADPIQAVHFDLIGAFGRYRHARAVQIVCRATQVRTADRTCRTRSVSIVSAFGPVRNG